MKKLITAIAAIATSFGLFADGANSFTNSVLSDIQSKTNNLVVGYDTTGATMLDDTGDVTVNWFADSLKTDFTTKMETYEQPELKVGEDEEGPYKYLAIDTDVGDPVLRTFNNVVEDTGVDNFKYNNIAISDHGVFIDTETTFTLFDTVPDAPGDSKILVWARETEADEDAGIVGATNLMVSCGWYDAGQEVTVPTNYVLDVNGIVPEQMYRLTIRADKDGTKNTKFRVYLNGVQLKTVALDDQETTLDEFPSLVDRTQELGAAGFGGTGSLKGIDLLTETDAAEKVPFAADKTYLTVTWNVGVKSFTLAQDDCADQVINVTGEGETNLVVKAGAATVTPTFVTEPQYKLQDFLNEDETLNLEYEGNEASIDIPLYADASTLAIIAVQDRQGAGLEIDGVTQGDYPFVKDAVAAIITYGEAHEYSSAKITLKISETLDTAVTDFGDWTSLAGDITLDLNGKTIAVDSTKAWEGSWVVDNVIGCMINNNNEANITITNSAVECAQLIGRADVWLIYNTNGHIDLADASIKYNGTINSANIPDEDFYGTLTIYGGKFKSNDPEVIILTGEGNGLAEGKTWDYDSTDEYYLVRDEGAFTLTLTAGDGNQITSDPAAGSIAEGTEVTVTVTPNTGYQFAKESYEGWVKDNGNLVSNFTMTASVSITAPDATAIPYAITYEANGGEGSTSSTMFTIENTNTVRIAACGFTKTGFKFTCWTENNDGSGASYDPGDAIPALANLTLYAQWEQDAPTTVAFSLTLNANVTKVVYSINNATPYITVTATGAQAQADLNVGDVVKIEDVCYAIGYFADTGAVKGTTATAESAPIALAFSAKQTAAQDLPADVTAEEAGISNTAFQGESGEVIKNACAWNTTYGTTGHDINTAVFEAGVPKNTEAEAYLLNCSQETTALNEAKAAFKFPAIVPGTNPTIVGEKATGDTYQNGVVTIYGADAVDGPYTAVEGATTYHFYKATLTKPVANAPAP